MGAFRCLVAILVVEIAYVFLPDEPQEAVSWFVSQGQFALALFGALLAYSYRHPMGKGSLLIGFLWSVTLAATDWWIPYEPIWGPAVAPAGVLLWLLWLRWRHDVVQSGEGTGRPNGDDAVPPSRPRRRWGLGWE